MPPRRHSVPGVHRGNMDFQMLDTLISRIVIPHTKPFTHGFSCGLFNRDVLYMQDGLIAVVSLFLYALCFHTYRYMYVTLLSCMTFYFRYAYYLRYCYIIDIPLKC